jgi:hypothetical protein
MMSIAASQHSNARCPCRPSTGHGLARAYWQFGPLWKALFSINALLFDRDSLPNHRNRVDQCARLTRHNSGTASAARKSP